MSSSAKALIVLAAILAFITLANCKSLSVAEEQKYKHLIRGQGLYTTADDVEILTAENFKPSVFRQNAAYIVEFYNSWCGFCQRFAPSWKALATDTKSWKRMIHVAAIDCAFDENSPLCREFEIMSYPTLRYFHEFYQVGIGSEVKKGADLEELKFHLLATMLAEQQKGRGAQYPNLEPYRHANLENLKSEVGNAARFVFLMIDAEGTIGPQLELDFAAIPEIGIRFTNTNNTALLSALHHPHVPALLALDSNGKIHILAGEMKTRDEFRQAIVDYVRPVMNIKFEDNSEVFSGKWADSQVPDMNMLLQEREKHAIRQRIKLMGDTVFQVDLESALRRSLKNEVGSQNEIGGEKLQALRQYVNVLRKYFPFGRNGQIFLMTLSNLINSREMVQGNEIARLVVQNEPESRMVFSSKHNWMACEGSSSTKRGYPCGLWKLFHYLTVQASQTSSSENPLEVLSAMYGYIKHFFGCSDCSRHFQEMAQASNLNGVESLDEAILWLWQAHNQVNNRIAGDATEDEEYPKVQFPTAKNCPQCRAEDGSFKSAEVLNYLKSMYNRARIQYLGSNERLFQSANNPQRRSVFQFDTSTCFIIYFVSFLLLIILIRLFLKRGYRKKMYAHDLLGKV